MIKLKKKDLEKAQKRMMFFFETAMEAKDFYQRNCDLEKNWVSVKIVPQGKKMLISWEWSKQVKDARKLVKKIDELMSYWNKWWKNHILSLSTPQEKEHFLGEIKNIEFIKWGCLHILSWVKEKGLGIE